MEQTWEQMFQDIEVDFDSKLLSTDFWSNEDQIEQYCYSILRYFGTDFKSVHVTLNANMAMQTSSQDGRFSIGVPKLNPTSDPEKIKRQIYAKAMVLRHELAHVIFSDLNVRTEVLNPGVLDNIYRYCEDSRIEHLYGNRFRGSINGFHKLIKTACISKESMMRLNMQPFSARNFSYYFRLRSSGMEGLHASDTMKMYEELYQKYANQILNNTDVQVVYRLYNQIYDEAVALEPKQPKKQKNQAPEDPASEEDFDGTDQPEPEDGDEGEMPEMPSEEDESGEGEMPVPSSDESEESEDGDEEVETPQVPSDGDEAEESEESEENGESDGDDRDAPEGKTNDKKGEKSSEPDEDEDKDEEVNDDDDDDEVDDKEPFTDPYEALSDMARTSPDYFDVYDENIDNMAFDGAATIPLFELWPFLRKNKKYSSSEGFKEYGHVVQQNKAVIISVTKFLALKLQHKNKVHNLVYQPEGDLDQDNLKEIIINHNDPRAFHRQIIKKSIGSNVILLLDFSASMGDNQIRACVVNCIIMMEVCKRLNINYEISAFTSSNVVRLPINATVSAIKTRMRKYGDTIDCAVQIDKNSAWNNLNSAPNGKIIKFSIAAKNNRSSLFVLKSITEKHAKIHECIMGNMYVEQRIISKSGTPEFQAMVNVYKRMRHNKNNILFLLNDGAYEGNFIYWTRHNNVALRLRDYRMHGTCAAPATFNRGMEFITKFFDYVKNNSEFRETIVKNICESWYLGGKIKSEEVHELINKIIEDTNDVWKTIGAVINDTEAYAKLTKIKSTNFEIEKSGDVLILEITKKNDSTELQQAYNEIISAFERKFDEITSYTDVVYKKFIDNMRSEGFRIMGIGIRSEYGKRYIGEDNFDVIEDLNDIRKNFANKLKNVW